MVDAPIRRPSNVRGMLPGGENTYVDFPGAKPQRVRVDYHLEAGPGEPWVTFLDVDAEDTGLRVDARTLAGTFTRTL